MNTPQCIYRFASEMGNEFALPVQTVSDVLEHNEPRWRVDLFKSRSHQTEQRSSLRFLVAQSPHENGLTLVSFEPNAPARPLPIKDTSACAEFVFAYGKRLEWCSNPSCIADLSEPLSVIRTYINKSGGDAREAEGHYQASEGNFESDAFSGFDGDSYDLLDDSDRCAACDVPV